MATKTGGMSDGATTPKRAANAPMRHAKTGRFTKRGKRTSKRS